MSYMHDISCLHCAYMAAAIIIIINFYNVKDFCINIGLYLANYIIINKKTVIYVTLLINVSIKLQILCHSHAMTYIHIGYMYWYVIYLSMDIVIFRTSHSLYMAYSC